LEIVRSRALRPTASPTVPNQSKFRRCREAVGGGSRTGITTTMATNAARATAPVAQKSTRHEAYSATAAAIGSPSAPPMPIEALIRPIAAPALSRGSTSWRSEIPSGIIALPRPWRPRPMIIVATSWATAHTAEPTMNGTIAATRIFFLPNMSPSRPATGVEIAPTSRVIVMTQEVLETSVWKIWGRLAMIGTTRVWARETTMPVAASTATSGPVFVPGSICSGRVGSVAVTG
jgi:hypothetical protein